MSAQHSQLWRYDSGVTVCYCDFCSAFHAKILLLHLTSDDRPTVSGSMTSTTMATRTSPSQRKPFRLLDLPPELWSKIGKRVLDNDGSSAMWCTISMKSAKAMIAPAITQTCRSLRQELLPRYYETRVEVRSLQLDRGVPLKNIGTWLKAVDGEYRKHIRNIEVDLRQGEVERWKRHVREVWGLGFELVECDEGGRNRLWGRQTHELRFC